MGNYATDKEENIEKGKWVKRKYSNYSQEERYIDDTSRLSLMQFSLYFKRQV